MAGKKAKNPRYNLLSCRVSHALGGRTVQSFLHEAIEDKLIDERQARIDKIEQEHRQ